MSLPVYLRGRSNDDFDCPFWARLAGLGHGVFELGWDSFVHHPGMASDIIENKPIGTGQDAHCMTLTDTVGYLYLHRLFLSLTLIRRIVPASLCAGK
jgi:hypothetical protein